MYRGGLPRRGALALHVEYAERGNGYDILFIFSLFCENIHLEYVRIHGLYRVNQTEYVIHILVIAPHEYVNTYSTRRVLAPHPRTMGYGPGAASEVPSVMAAGYLSLSGVLAVHMSCVVSGAACSRGNQNSAAVPPWPSFSLRCSSLAVFGLACCAGAASICEQGRVFVSKVDLSVGLLYLYIFVFTRDLFVFIFVSFCTIKKRYDREASLLELLPG